VAGKAFRRVFYAVVWGLIVASGLWRAEMTAWRWINADEFEHLHAAWCVKEGMLLYRDFFEVHTPVFYWGLAGVIAPFAPEESMARGWAAILASRYVMFALTGVILWLVYKLGREVHSAAAGALAVVFTLSTMMFVDRTIEVRPDVPSVAAMLAAVYLTLRVFRGDTKRPLRVLFWAGVLWCAGYLCTPKILMALLGFCPAVFLLLIDPRQGLSIRRQAAMGFSLLGGFLAPLAVTAGFFAVQGALWHFVHYTFLLGINWKHKLNPWDAAGELAYENPALVALGLAGLAGTLAMAVGPWKRRRTLLIPAGTTVGVIAGVFLVPVPYTEYMLMPVVMLAVFEGMVVVEMVKVGGWRKNERKRWGRVVMGICGAVGVGWIVWKLKPPVVVDGVEAGAWVLAMIGVGVALRYRQRYAALTVLLVMLMLFPLRRTQILQQAPTNGEQRERMAYIYSLTGAADPVMDGWHNMGAPFRPHAWYYWFLPIDMRPLVSEAEYGAFREKIESGEVAPRVIVMDRDTEALPAPLVGALKERYAPGAVAPVWVRKGVRDAGEPR
jgi:hypothetical protein